MRKLAVSKRRTSAETRLPTSKMIISPTTNSGAETSCQFPSRLTLTVGTASFFKAAIAFSARYS